MAAIPDRDFHTQLAGFSLTTAEILYRMPDHPSLLQSYIGRTTTSTPPSPGSSISSISGRAISRASSIAPQWPTRGSLRRRSYGWSLTSSACTNASEASHTPRSSRRVRGVLNSSDGCRRSRSLDLASIPCLGKSGRAARALFSKIGFRNSTWPMPRLHDVA